MDTGATCRNQDDVALARDDQGRGIEECGDPERGRSSCTGPEAELEGDLCAVRADHAVDFVRGDAGVGERSQCPDQSDRCRVVIRKGAGLLCVVDSGDGHATEGV